MPNKSKKRVRHIRKVRRKWSDINKKGNTYTVDPHKFQWIGGDHFFGATNWASITIVNQHFLSLSFAHFFLFSLSSSNKAKYVLPSRDYRIVVIRKKKKNLPRFIYYSITRNIKEQYKCLYHNFLKIAQ